MYKFEKLTVWQKSFELIKDTYQFIDKLPQQENYNLKDQLRRSVVSISLNIAEGSGAENDVEFKRFLIISKKSLFEVIATLKIIKFIYRIETNDLELKTEEISKMLTGLIKAVKTND